MAGGRGVLLGGVPGVPAARVVIIGGGIVGTNAAKMAVGLGARVTIIDNNLDRLRELDDIFLSRITTLASSAYAIQGAISEADRHNIRGEKISVDTIPLVGEQALAEAVRAASRLPRARVLYASATGASAVLVTR